MKFVLVFVLLWPLSSNCLAASPMLSSISAANNLSSKQSDKKTKPSKSTKLKVPTRKDAIKRVKRQHKGKVLKASSTRNKGVPGYKVKMITNDGVVFYVHVDAQTGRVSRHSR
ncbi:MAG: PepSY domain-containing protein [Porticoccaceae bacterium]|nr:PepSY domain-containing protein [Porticoccaceae bacterium]